MDFEVSEIMRRIKLYEIGIIDKPKAYDSLYKLLKGYTFKYLTGANSTPFFHPYDNSINVFIPPIMWEEIKDALELEFKQVGEIIGKFIGYKYGHANLCGTKLVTPI